VLIVEFIIIEKNIAIIFFNIYFLLKIVESKKRVKKNVDEFLQV